MNPPIYIDESYAESVVYHSFVNKRHENVYLVKVSFLDIGLHVNSITVQPSPKHPERGLWVQLPRFNSKGHWIWPLQIRKDSPIRELIDRLALQAVDNYSGSNGGTPYGSSDDMSNNPAPYLSDGISDFTNVFPP